MPYASNTSSAINPPNVCAARRDQRLLHIARDFYATMESQLSVFVDDVVESISESDRHWWLVRELQSGQTGYIPSDIVETPDEHEAKINRQRNLELTRIRATDSPRGLGLNQSTESLVSDDTPEKPWSRSGFAKKPVNLRSAPVPRSHKKTVSFSETKPVEHLFLPEDSDSSEEFDQIRVSDQSPVGRGYYDHNIDPVVDELLQREFGKPIEAERGIERRAFEEAIIPQMEPNRDARKRTSVKPSKLKTMMAKFWRARLNGDDIALQNAQLLRIYAGNFTAVNGYKTILVDEDASMAEVADKACDKFGVIGDGFDYMLSVVHYDSHEILHVAANYSLATVIELAKRATLLEGQYAETTDKSISRLSRRLRKQQDKSIRLCKSALPSPSGTGLASPLFMQSLAEELTRDKESDFVTHFKFVLNRWLEGPAPTIPFYLRVQMAVGSTMARSLGALSAATGTAEKRPKSPITPKELKSAFPTAEDVKLQGTIKMLVNTSMSVAELSRAALSALDVAPVPGIKYELFFASKPAQTRDRIYLTKEMAVHDILHLRPLVDPSGLLLVLQPVVDSKPTVP